MHKTLLLASAWLQANLVVTETRQALWTELFDTELEERLPEDCEVRSYWSERPALHIELRHGSDPLKFVNALLHFTYNDKATALAATELEIVNRFDLYTFEDVEKLTGKALIELLAQHLEA